MPQGSPLPPLEYLLECSDKSLADLELSALNRSQQCLKAAKSEWEEALAQRECAGVARWLIENRKELLRGRAIDVPLPFPRTRTA
jgi:hypothetical protein